MKFLRKVFLGILFVTAVCFAVTSCTKKDKKDSDNVVYTYREVWSTGPLNWNPHTWETNLDGDMLGYLTTPLIAMDKVDGGEYGEWEWVYEGATAITDITESFPDKAKYEIPEDAKERRVYQIDLNQNMKWENGDLITADDYVYSMQMLLSPEMKNTRSSYFTNGEAAIYNAAKYINNDRAGKTVYKAWEVNDPEDKKFVFSLKDDIYFFGEESAEKAYRTGKQNFMNGEVDLFEKYKSQEVFEITEESKADMLVIAKAFGDESPQAWKEFRVYDTGKKYEETPWENVGFVKTGEYQFLFITAAPLPMFDMRVTLSSSFLVHKDTYEKYFKTVEGLKATSYGTELASTISAGPYKIENYEKDKQIRLVRNTEWGGYKNPKNEGCYVADAIVIDIIEDHATVMQRFGQGLVDTVRLTSDDIEKYKKSDRVFYTEESYTARIIFATDLESLKHRDEERGGGRRAVVHYKDFRKALSLSIDREKYCREATAAFVPALCLFNKFYYYDIGNDPNSVYRNSYYAKKAILDLYGVDSSPKNADANYSKLTGRDLGLAKQFFTNAYKQAVADGNYKDGEEIPIEIMMGKAELQPHNIKQQDLLQEFFDEGSKGTPFEGKIKVKFESGDAEMFANVANGKNMAIIGAWGGAYYYPFRMIGVYVSPSHVGGLENIHESNGFDPTKINLKLKINKENGTTYEDTRSLSKWYDAINGDGDFVKAPASEKLQILAALEHEVLAAYCCIPLGTMTTAELVSYKIDFGFDYHIMYLWGGLKHFKFHYTDAEWDEYVKKNQGQLHYE